MGDLARQLDTFLRAKPRLGKNVYITQSAVVLGDVRIGDHSSIWYNATVRGDINYIQIGHYTNIQDNAVVHLADEFPCIIGDYVTVGHSAIVHACTLGNQVLVGMGAIILDGAVVEDQCLIGANSLVTNGTRIPAGSLVLGTPAKIVRALTPEERAGLKVWAEKYVEGSAYCLKHRINVGGPMAG
jgi:carbonic anhydrase/acetyltransferase-like protein (isoleucine patch superfamily)